MAGLLGVAMLVSLVLHSYLGTAWASTMDDAKQRKVDEYLATSPDLEPHNLPPSQVQKVKVRERIGEQLDRDLTFVDEDGQTVRLGDFLDGERPVLLSLNYYDCPTLCSLQLNAYARAIQQMDWLPGKEFRVVTVSINPRNEPWLAKTKRQAYLGEIAREGSDWRFLLDQDGSAAKLAEAVGFEYSYDEQADQYAHAAVTYLVTPEGKISRYLYGISPSPRDLKFALMDASEGRLGTTVERFVLNCFQFDDLHGRYTPFAINTMRVGGAMTVSGIFVWLGVLWNRDKKRRRREKIA